jgi:TonB family protein
MRPSTTALVFAILLNVLTAATRAQDMPLRVEAVRLLEHANAVSQASQLLPNRKEQVTFRAYGLDGSTKEGALNMIYGRDRYRYEVTIGNYHAVSIHYKDHFAQNGYQLPPPETLELEELIPIRLVRFDASDTIHAITPATIFGRRAQCIQFETVNGRKRSSNEICVYQENGALVRLNLGGDPTENSEFTTFEGVLLPGRIRHYLNGKLRMEVEQKYSVIAEPIDWDALAVPDAVEFHQCAQYRRAIIQSAPQPAAAGPGPWYDVRVHAAITEEGRVVEAEVLPAGKPELEQQAIQIVSGWTFLPSTCDGKPHPVPADLTVHFPPQ